jgi:hypothetical protein
VLTHVVGSVGDAESLTSSVGESRTAIEGWVALSGRLEVGVCNSQRDG